MQLGRISFPMLHNTSIRSPYQYTKRNFIRPPITAWPKKHNYLWDTGEEAYICSNGTRRQHHYHRPPSARSDRVSQAGDRLFRIHIFHQLLSLIPDFNPFLDLPQMAINEQKEPINRINYGAPPTAKTE